MSALDHPRFLAFTIAFAPATDVKTAVRNQLSQWWKRGILDNEYPPNLRPFQLEKEHNPAVKRVFLFEVEAQEPATLIEANLNDGYASLTHMVSGALPDYRFISVRSSSSQDEWPIQEFSLLQNQRQVRFVRTMRETGGWDYWEEGEIQPFEEPQAYKLRSKQDRITRNMIVRYLDQLSINLPLLLSGERARPLAAYVEAS